MTRPVVGVAGAVARAPAPTLLFFGDIASLSRDEYAERVAAVFGTERRLYRAMVDNIHDHSVFLVTQKYRYLRYSYFWFSLAFVAGAAGVVAKQVAG